MRCSRFHHLCRLLWVWGQLQVLPYIWPLQVSPNLYDIFFLYNCLQKVLGQVHSAMHDIEEVADEKILRHKKPELVLVHTCEYPQYGPL